MFAVIFEVQPKEKRWNEYLDLAKFLKPELERIDGFIDNERFASKRDKRRILSLSIWRDEKSVIRWRTQPVHHDVQQKGRSEIFADYHLRVGEVVADTQAPSLSEQRFDETETGAAKALTISELAPSEGEAPVSDDLARDLGLPPAGASGLVDHEIFESIYVPGKLLLLAGWRDAAGAASWTPAAPASGRLRHRLVRVIRDYGMTDRREAPQYYPEIR